ncbi:MAG: hypothetical protein COB53_08110 [Elusimicrobia bacterium]|nr:MAG: hypothetical protein COB53_08110 [Elusimicrobiota bacterium]
MKNFIKRLEAAQGRSEFVIAVMCDIRGFSKFSSVHESPDLAMFIKRFYLKLLRVYFRDAVFAKPTGDGLLIIYRYSENLLDEVSRTVISQCFKALKDFPTMFKDDPMVNFKTPSSLGFGIARGTTCCLYSKRHIIDYSGQLLNLAARLNDIARPRGIVLDGAYSTAVIPREFRSRFFQRHVYLRSIAEETAREVFCSKGVVLPPYATTPLANYSWSIDEREFRVSELKKLKGSYLMSLKDEAISMEKAKLQFIYPDTALPGYSFIQTYLAFKYYKDANGAHLDVDTSLARALVSGKGFSPGQRVRFEFQYVPKRKKKKRVGV